MKVLSLQVIPLLSALFSSSNHVSTVKAQGDQNLVATLGSRREFSALFSLLDIAGLKNAVATGGNFTVFAPTNEAFESQESVLDKFLLDTDVWNRHLQCVLLHHVSQQIVFSAALRVGMVIPSEDQDNEGIVVLSLDQPPTIDLEEGFSQPNITEPDIIATNGVIHKINDVLLPFCAVVGIENVDVVPELTTLHSLLELTDIPQRDVAVNGPSTLFAVPNEVFDTVAPCVLEELRKDIPKLTTLLEYHFSPLNIFSSDYDAGTTEDIPTLLDGGATIEFTKNDDGSLEVDGYPVVNQDEPIRSGVVHVIPGILKPPGFEMPACPSMTNPAPGGDQSTTSAPGTSPETSDKTTADASSSHSLWTFFGLWVATFLTVTIM